MFCTLLPSPGDYRIGPQRFSELNREPNIPALYLSIDLLDGNAAVLRLDIHFGVRLITNPQVKL